MKNLEHERGMGGAGPADDGAKQRYHPRNSAGELGKPQKKLFLSAPPPSSLVATTFFPDFF